MSRHKLIIGRVYEVCTPAGLAYFQHTHDDRSMGELVRVLPGLYPARPHDIASLTRQHELYFACLPLQNAVEKKLVEAVSHQAVPQWAEPFPVMRKRGAIDRSSGETLYWFIGDGSKMSTIDEISHLERVRDLTPEQRALSIRSLWSISVLIENLTKGWTPSRDDELGMAARASTTRAGVEAPQSERGYHLGTVEHYLYFKQKTSADEAARSLRGRGYKVTVRLGGDGESWLVLATLPLTENYRIERVRDELERVASKLGGEYDGWGIPQKE